MKNKYLNEDYESIQSETTKIIQEISFILIRRVNICIFLNILLRFGLDKPRSTDMLSMINTNI